MQTETVDIAQKRRHLHLLEKVRNHQTLKRSELKELQEYEKQMAQKKKKPVIAVKRKKTKSKKSKAKKPPQKTAKKKKAKTKKTRPPRPPVSPATVKALAMVSADLAAADVQLNLKKPLADILGKFEKLQRAWDRGRMLRNLQQFAATAVTIAEAEDALGMETGKLKELLETDLEVADIWNEARLQTIIDIKRALVDSAKDGRPAAAKQIEGILRREIAHPKVDFRHLPIAVMVEMTGKTRQTIHDWTTKHGLPRNADKTYDLAEFLRWFESFTIKKVNTSGKPSLADIDPLKSVKAEKLKTDLQKQKGQLLDRGQVITGQLARLQSLVNSLARKPEELAMLCHGQPPAKIARILNTFFDDVRRQQCEVPAELQLPPDLAKQFAELLEKLRPEGEQ